MGTTFEMGERRFIREDRGMMLDMLHGIYRAGADGLAEDELFDILLTLPRQIPKEKAQRDVAVLSEVGLIEQIRPKHPITGKPMRVRWKLTARGCGFIEAGKPWETLGL